MEDLHRTRRICRPHRRGRPAGRAGPSPRRYADVEQAFGGSSPDFSPGARPAAADEPDNCDQRGEVEARPPGKKIKGCRCSPAASDRWSRWLFWVSLFIARPSPFYILDEVEAALDDVNLGRLLDIYAELRENSQLLVITHQKRTMEIADALYGVTMRGDGVSTVISQRLRETASVA